LLKRYVPGLGLDSVVTAYEGSGYDRRWLLADERRSVVSVTDGAANAISTNTYDEYGQPGSGNGGRFQYTGQMWLPQAQLYHYRARAPQLGRFMQTDPIGYAGGANLYAYVGADPVNWADTLGLGPTDPGDTWTCYPGMDCNSTTEFPDIEVVVRKCSQRATFCLDPSDLVYVDIGLSVEFFFFVGAEYQRGYTFVVDTSGENYVEVGRCDYSSLTTGAGLGAGLGPTGSTGEGAPDMYKDTRMWELSALVVSGGFEDISFMRMRGTPTGGLSANLSDGAGLATGRARIGVGGKFGKKTTTRSNCRPRGSY
jgi:RHS repeat-associated protein